MIISNARPFEGGTLTVTDIPLQKCDCEEEIPLADAALMAGYARMLTSHKIIGDVTVPLSQLAKNFSMEDFFSQKTAL